MGGGPRFGQRGRKKETDLPTAPSTKGKAPPGRKAQGDKVANKETFNHPTKWGLQKGKREP